MFKGTENRSALQISKDIDALGGMLNASTSKEYTVYYTKVLDEHLDKAADVLFDLFLNSTFDEIELEKEKKVVLQEIHMSEDTPDDHITDLFSEAFYGATVLGRPILGDYKSVSSITRDDLLDFIANCYDPESIVVVGTGSIDHDQLVALAAPKLEGLQRKADKSRELVKPQGGQVNCHHKDLEQVQITLGTHGPAVTDATRWSYIVLNNILGGSMSSMLFQEIREKLGLVYSVYSYQNLYRDCGAFVVYAGTTPDNVERTIDTVVTQMQQIKRGDFGSMSLDDVKGQIKGNLLLSRESTESRMTSNARNEIYFNREVTLDEVMEKIQAVDSDQVIALAEEIFRPELMTLVTLGRVSDISLKF